MSGKLTATNIIPQPAIAGFNPATGQVFMLQHPSPFAYYLPRSYADSPQTIHPQQHHFIQHQPPTHHLRHPHPLALPAPGPAPIVQQQPRVAVPQVQATPSPVQPKLQQTKQVQVQVQATPPQSKDQTNAKIRGIKEKCITHYIDGQLIIETSKPLKLKNNKKRKLQHQPQPQPQPPPPRLPSSQASPKVQTPSQTPQRLPSSQVSPKVQTPSQTPQLAQANQHTQSVQSQASRATPSTPISRQATPASKSTPNTPNGTPAAAMSSADVRKLRDEMLNWSVAEVVEFIERHEDIRQYSSRFAEDEIDGASLLLMIDRHLSVETITSRGIKLGPAFKIVATLSKYKMHE